MVKAEHHARVKHLAIHGENFHKVLVLIVLGADFLAVLRGEVFRDCRGRVRRIPKRVEDVLKVPLARQFTTLIALTDLDHGLRALLHHLLRAPLIVLPNLNLLAENVKIGRVVTVCL